MTILESMNFYLVTIKLLSTYFQLVTIKFLSTDVPLIMITLSPIKISLLNLIPTNHVLVTITNPQNNNKSAINR